MGALLSWRPLPARRRTPPPSNPPQDIAAVEDARQACEKGGQSIPEGFIRIVQMRAARANAAGVPAPV